MMRVGELIPPHIYSIARISHRKENTSKAPKTSDSKRLSYSLQLGCQCTCFQTTVAKCLRRNLEKQVSTRHTASYKETRVSKFKGGVEKLETGFGGKGQCKNIRKWSIFLFKMKAIKR